MDHLQQLKQQIRTYLLVILLLENVLVIGLCLGLEQLGLASPVAAIISLGLAIIASFGVAVWFSSFVLQPLGALWQTVLHLNPSESSSLPQVDNLKLGRELVANLTSQLYQAVNLSEQNHSEQERQASDLSNDFVALNLPLPLIVLDNQETIRFANQAAADYVGRKVEDMVGKNVYMLLDMSFISDETFDSWLQSAKVNSAIASHSWERVKLNVQDNHPVRLFDLAAYYNRGNPDQHETMLVIFDHTKEYSQDDQAISFMALSVHELRTPLTLLRGYIEVFEQELGSRLDDPELKNFMLKMHAMAEQLTAYVNNILNVERVDNDQLELRLQSEDWRTILKSAVEMMSLRAKVRDITLECRIALDLPPVAADRLSINEVINNLIDNAIKYSGQSKTIKIEARLNQEGLVETTVQDFGVGIPTSLLPNLFSKFYRDHRNRAQVGGTGLGLYLTKAIITAHGGSLWVRSHEGEGSTFGFSLIPYDKLDDAQKASDEGITRSAHGWIKNHSLYRR